MCRASSQTIGPTDARPRVRIIGGAVLGYARWRRLATAPLIAAITFVAAGLLAVRPPHIADMDAHLILLS